MEKTFKNNAIYEPLKWKVRNRITNNNIILLADKIITDIKSLKIIELRKIHNDKKISIELLLLFLSQFTGTIFKYNNKDYIQLYSIFLKKNYGDVLYPKILKVLLDNQIILLNKNYDVSNSKQYKLNNKYLKTTSYKSYILKEKRVIALKQNIITKKLERAESNIISRLTLIMYGLVSLPNEKELLRIGTNLVKEKQTKKGLRYRKRGKKSRALDKPNSIYIEDNIHLYKFLTQPSMFIPENSDDAGGRVTHSLNLCPSWIRKEVLIKLENIVELDFSALHPNIASSLYGQGRCLNHELIANELNITKAEIKIEHLSFFNKEIKDMKKSILWDFYKRYEPEMLNNIITEKHNNGYKTTTNLLFGLETQIMERVMIKLQKVHIYPIYVYDALYVSKSDARYVQIIMNDVVKEMNIPTKLNIK